MTEVKRRKPGGGRKSKGPVKSAVFSTRLPIGLRDALEAERFASEPPQTLTTVAINIIKLGLEVRRERQVEDPEAALGFLISALADLSWSPSEDGRRCEWHNDPSVFEAFKHALLLLLDRLRPEGSVDSSLEGPLVGRTPEQHGEYVFRQLWSSIQSSHEQSPEDIQEARQQHGFRPLPKTAAAAVSIGSYSFGRVRRALKIVTSGANEENK